MDRFRWKWAKDLNGDGMVTISEVWAWLGWLYYYPGDYMVPFYNYIILQSDFAKFLELTPLYYGGRFSWWISLAVWGFVFVMVVGLIVMVKEGLENLANYGRPKAEDE